MNESLILLIFYAVIVVLLALIIKRRQKNEQYDEMQQKIRADAYKRAFFTMIILLCGIIVYDTCAGKVLPPYVLSGLLIIVVMTSFLVFAVYSIWHDAFFYLGQSWKSYFGVCIAIGIIQLIEFISTISRYFDKSEHNENFWQLLISKVSTSAMMAITFITLAVVIGIKQIKENKVSED
ncbi:DUF6442 family protein [Butyrivibrio sp. AE3004]|uniref:DUF6442 family protein n=1 Tax=Butyrivibrio sp. AE3004 TaxID=1506994 RepID=UPI00049450A9|nr:DUF6442 family protein [Butyrivibrio sp. AE3004]